MTTPQADNETILLNSIDNYINNKETNNYIIENVENKTDITTEIEALQNNITNITNFYTELLNLFKSQYENNIEIGNYYDDKIENVNKLILEKKQEINDKDIDLEKQTILLSTAEKKLDFEYNSLIINKLKSHILYVVICILTIILSLTILKSQAKLSGFIVFMISMILVFFSISYVIYLLNSNHPRKPDEYNQFMFHTTNRNSALSSTDLNDINNYINNMNIS